MESKSVNSFLLGDKVWSYSAVNSFQTCRYAFKLSYIDLLDRDSNFFAELGLSAHQTMEKYWKGEIESYDLAKEFETAFDSIGVTPPPPFPVGMREKFVSAISEHLYTFEKQNGVEVLFVEKEILSTVAGIPIVVIPDFILKINGKVVMLDYKTANPFKGKNKKLDLDKMKSYELQVLLYAEIFERETGEEIDEIKINFLRFDGFEHIVEDTAQKRADALEWFKNGVKDIFDCEDFFAKPDNKYFCSQICGVRSHCEFKE